MRAEVLDDLRGGPPSCAVELLSPLDEAHPVDRATG